MKKQIKYYLFSLLSVLALMTVAQAKKVETAAAQVCADRLMGDNDDAYSSEGCPATCGATSTTADGGKWDGKGTFNGWWTNPGSGVDMGKCQYAICQCVPTTPPPPPSCCDSCATDFETCKTEGKLPILSCSLQWESCASACKKAKPGKKCTPPKGAAHALKKGK